MVEPPVKMLKIDDKNDISDASYPVAEEEVNTSSQGDSMLPVCCWHCSQDFPSFPLLTEHVRTSHQGQGRPGQRRHHRCARCGTVLSSMWKLRQHLASHHQAQAQERGAGKESDHQYGRSSRSTRAVVRRQGGDHGYATAKEIAGGRVEEPLWNSREIRKLNETKEMKGVVDTASDVAQEEVGQKPKETSYARGTRENIDNVKEGSSCYRRNRLDGTKTILAADRSEIPPVVRKKVLTFADCDNETDGMGGSLRQEEKTPPGSAVCSEHSYGTRRDSSPELEDTSPARREASDHMYSSAKCSRAIDEPFDDMSNQEESEGRGDIDDTEDGTDDYRSSAGPSGVVDHQYSQERSSPRLRRILPKLAVTRPQEHVQESPSLEIGLHPCLICRKTFPQAYRLKRHIREVHDKEKLYRCNDCDKEFFKSTSLIRHKISVHEKVRPFGCPNCESRFKDRSALKYHTRKKVCSSKTQKS